MLAFKNRLNVLFRLGDEQNVSKRKLLLADDSVTIQKVVNLTFADEGIEVIAVGNGDQAMERISESRPDMVLADVNMPGLSGYQICERLRGHPDTFTIPVLLLVGSFEPFDEDEARRVGANGHLTKPFQSIRQLVAKVSELMQETSADPEPAGFQDEDPEGNSITPHAAPAEEQGDDISHWSESVADEPETHDIDNLYHESFAQTVEIPQTEILHADSGAADRFADVGMDDEMIETTYHAPNTYVPDEPDHESEFVHGAAASPFEDRVSQTETGAPSVDDVHDIDPGSAEDTVRFDVPVAQPAAEPSFDLDGSELLELPKPPPANPQPVAISGRSDQSPTPEQLVSLSPELMDAIVRQVVERMSGGR